MNRRDLALLLALGALWGANFILVKVAVATIPPLSVAAGRVAIAAAVLLALGALRGRGRLPWRAFAVMGLLNGALPYLLIAWGLARIDGGLGAILNGTMPVFTAVLAAATVRRERLGLGRAGGLLLGLAGVVVLVGPEAVRGVGGAVWGQLAVVGAAASYAAAAVYGRRLSGLAPMTAAAGQLAAATAWLLPFALLLDAPWALRPAALSLGAVLLSALACTALAYLIYFRLLASAGPTRLSLVTYLIPLTAVGWGALLLGERPGWGAAFALCLIMAGIAAVNGQVPRLGLPAGRTKRRAAPLAAAGDGR